MSTIKNWQKGDGNYKIDEIAIAQGSEITTFSGGTVMSNITSTGYTHAYTSGSQNIAAIKSVSAYSGVAGHKYIVTFDVTINSGSVTGTFNISAMGKAGQNITMGSNTYIINGSNGSNGTYISINSSTAVNYTISNFKMYDVPPLPTITTGTKYLECTSNGTISIAADLDSFVNNGYICIDRYDGSNWTRHEDTVSNLSIDESWFDYSNKKITLTGTTSNRFTNIKIYNGERI